MSEDFTLGGYQALLAAFRARGYAISGYDAVDIAAPHLILRHDIDISIEHALKLATAEADAGIASTYFVLLRSELYNPLSRPNLAALRQIAAQGHDIGLHFDAALYENDLSALDQAARFECDLLEQALGRAVRMVSFHRPARSLLGYDALLGGRTHTYAPKFFAEIGYCSDARGSWRFGHPLNHEAVRAKRAIQLVTHPIWWCAFGGETPVEKLDRYFLRRMDQLRAEMAFHCKAYRKDELVQLTAPVPPDPA